MCECSSKVFMKPTNAPPSPKGEEDGSFGPRQRLLSLPPSLLCFYTRSGSNTRRRMWYDPASPQKQLRSQLIHFGSLWWWGSQRDWECRCLRSGNVLPNASCYVKNCSFSGLLNSFVGTFKKIEPRLFNFCRLQDLSAFHRLNSAQILFLF